MRKSILRSFALIMSVLFIATALFAQEQKPAEEVKPAVVAKPGQLNLFDKDGWKLNFYGFVKLDAVYNSTNVNNETSPMWVETEKARDSENSGSLVFAIRTTRFGFKVQAPTVLKATPIGVIEVDFWGQMPASGTPSRQGQIRMRHAFVRLDWPTKTYLLVGQYWSTVMALEVLPDTTTFIPCGYSGLLFMREAQITIGQTFGPQIFSTKFEVSLARAQGGDDSTDTGRIFKGEKGSQADERGSGDVSYIPGVRAKLVFESKPIDKMQIIFGGTGSYQRERNQKYVTNPAPAQPTYKALVYNHSYVAMGFVKVAYSLFSISGNFFHGENIDVFLAGIGYGTTPNGNRVSSIGGWGQVSLDLNKIQVAPLAFNVGYGFENIKKTTLPVGGRKYNAVLYANTWIYLSQYYKIGLEFGKHDTKYLGSEIRTDYRGHLAFQFIF